MCSALLRMSIVGPSASASLLHLRVGRHGSIEVSTAVTCLLCCVGTLAKQKAVSPARLGRSGGLRTPHSTLMSLVI